MVLPKEVEHWSLTTLREKLVKIGAKVVRYGRYVTFQLAEVAVQLVEVAVPWNLFQEILRRVDELRRRPAPAQAEEIDGEEKATREVCLDGEKNDRMGFWTSPTDEYRAIRKAAQEYHSNGGAIWVWSERIWKLSGKCRFMWLSQRVPSSLSRFAPLRRGFFRAIIGCGQPCEHGDLRFGVAHGGRSARGFVITPVTEHLFEHTIPAVGLAGADGSLNSHASDERDSELLLIIPVACFYGRVPALIVQLRIGRLIDAKV